jgi:hypothetical protein
MLTQLNDARLRATACDEGPGLSILRAGLCAVLVLAALATPAQAQSDHTNLTLPYHHFSGASAVLNREAPDFIAATTVNADPVPIPGGLAPTIHIFAPGPTGLGFQGLDVEPNGITNFNGFAALAYLSGTATDSKGNKFNLSSDMRLYRGEYISSDGTHHRGTFVFI